MSRSEEEREREGIGGRGEMERGHFHRNGKFSSAPFAERHLNLTFGSYHITSSASTPEQAELLVHLKFENRLRPFQPQDL